MSNEDLIAELAQLDLEERRKIAGYLINLNKGSNEEQRRAHTAALLSDPPPSRWIAISPSLREESH